MTEEQIKAKLSQHFVETLASRRGFKCRPPDLDHGVDLAITRAIPVVRNGRTRLMDDGTSIEIQLKSTCESQVVRTDTGLKYDLEVKTWNDLVWRRKSESPIPLFLVLVVLPDEAAEWVRVNPEDLIIRGSAYWYRPDENATESDNVSTIRIEISHSQAVGLSFVEDRFTEAFV